ncbi:MAG: DUF1573 domain-containing protein [Planctomycetota bacterium]|nr:DUF1573 domain-containing protein [Planctomycetota bacterium]
MIENTVGCDRKTPFLPCVGLAAVLAMLLACQLGCREESSGSQAPVTETEVKVTRVVPREPLAAAEGVETDSPEMVEIANPHVGNAPRIVMASVEHDFGEIGPDTSHKAEFPFTNAGTAPLRITQVRSCCGVVTRGVKPPQEYAPGRGGVLEIDYRATSQPGSMRRNLYIQSNDPAQGLVTLTIKATIKPRVHFEPSTLKLFLKQDNAGAGDITLASLDGRPFAITGFRAIGIKADFDPRVEATEFVLKPIADIEKLKSNLRGQISIDLTHPECRNVRILYDVLPEFAVNPPTIMLFNLKASQPVEREIWVLSNYQDDFEIESVSSQKGIVTLVSKTKIQNRYQLTLRITPPPAEGERAVLSDVIEVKIKDGETVAVQCRGFY